MRVLFSSGDGSPRLRSDESMMRHEPAHIDAGNSFSVPGVGQEGTIVCGITGRVEQMERTETRTQAASGTRGADPGTPGTTPVTPGGTAPSYRTMTAFTPADEERQRGVRRMKLT